MDKIIETDGSNGFSIPHMGKDKILKENARLPVSVQASEEALAKVEAYKEAEEQAEQAVMDELTGLLEE